jgi:hypothetical protein
MLIDRALTALATAAAIGLGALSVTLWMDVRDAERTAQRLRATLAEERAQWATDRATLATAAAQASEQARATETAWRSAHDDIAAAAARQQAAARADADRARAAADSLRQWAAAYAAQCNAPAAAGHPAPGHPPAAPGSPPAGNAGMVLADMLSRLDARARELAALADARAAAGTTCERAYDALTTTPRPPAAAPPH